MKVYILSKKKFVFCVFAGLMTLVLGFSFLVGAEGLPVNAKPQKRLPIYSVETGEKKLALTFDCAWENSDTKILIELLEKYNVKATFFVTGDWCERYPEEVKLLFKSGHAVENHSYGHPHVASISKEKLIEDTNRCFEVIKELTGIESRLYRAPYGEYSDGMLKILEDELNYRVIQWNVDSVDWKGRSAEEMEQSVCKKVNNGSILLFHTDTKNTPQALEKIIPKLQNEGYSFELIKDMIDFEGFELNHEGRQIIK